MEIKEDAMITTHRFTYHQIASSLERNELSVDDFMQEKLREALVMAYDVLLVSVH